MMLRGAWKIERNVLNVDYHVSQYTKVIAELRAQVSALQQDLQQERARYVLGRPHKGAAGRGRYRRPGAWRHPGALLPSIGRDGRVRDRLDSLHTLLGSVGSKTVWLHRPPRRVG